MCARLTVADLALQEGGRGQARAHRIAEAALGVQALAGAALRQRPGAQVHVLGGRLWATGRPQEDSQLRENHWQPLRDPAVPRPATTSHGPLAGVCNEPLPAQSADEPDQQPGRRRPRQR